MNKLTEIQKKKFALRNNIRVLSSVLMHQRKSKANRAKLRATIDKLEAELEQVEHMSRMAQ